MSPLGRLDHLTLLVMCGALAIVQRDAIHWGWFAALFAAIDLVGFLPGALLQRARGAVPAWGYHLYNVAHGVPFSLGLAAAWSLARGGPDWTLLALPLHLCADRGLLGNGFKALDVPFDLAGRQEVTA